MKRIPLYICLCLLIGCKGTTNLSPELPPIWPDYVNVSIPVGIAPLNFNLLGSYSSVYVLVEGSNGESFSTKGKYANFPIRKWHKILEGCKGGYLKLSVLGKEKGGDWTQFRSFNIIVSDFSLDDYGISYRKMAPGYETYSRLGIYQRNLSNFKEYPIIESTLIPGHCVGCHTANQTDPEQFVFHIRGANGGTVEQISGQYQYLNTRAEGQIGSVVYSYWHPSGDFYACSTNLINQSFWTGTDARIEVYDRASDVMVMDARSHELLCSDLLSSPKRETYPVFSPDGKTLYFCQAEDYPAPAQAEKIQYNLCSIDFDYEAALNGEKDCFQGPIKTVVNAQANSKSITMPRPSYDGRWLMYCLSDFSCFPINRPEADLWIMDLRDGSTRCLDEVNSEQSESYHNWSSNSNWFLFSSRRGNGVYGKTYFACIDETGNVSKPFLLPQKNPLKYYNQTPYSFNVPDFTKHKIEFKRASLASKVLKGKEKIQVKVKQYE